MDIRIIASERLKSMAEVVGYQYKRDPDHRHKPSGGGWHETPKGWSTAEQAERKEGRKETLGGSSFWETGAARFHDLIVNARASQPEDKRWRVDAHGADEYKNCKTYSTEGKSTVAVTGDGDIISVCKNASSQDRGSDLLKFAVAHGGMKLDAFGALWPFYTKNGFEPVSVTDFDREYAPDGWDPDRDDEEPIIFYRYTGVPYTKMSYDEFLSSVPHHDYETAGRIRDKEIQKNEAR